MVAGHLREKRGYYHIVLSYTDENGNRQTPSKTTGLPVKGNKKRAEAMLIQARREKEAELQLLAATKGRRKSGAPVNITFTKFIIKPNIHTREIAKSFSFLDSHRIINIIGIFCVIDMSDTIGHTWTNTSRFNKNWIYRAFHFSV